MTKDPLFVKHFGLLAYGEQYEQLLPLAQSYTKEISIGFAKWMDKNVINYTDDIGLWGGDDCSTERTTEELFNIYLKEKEQ